VYRLRKPGSQNLTGRISFIITSDFQTYCIPRSAAIFPKLTPKHKRNRPRCIDFIRNQNILLFFLEFSTKYFQQIRPNIIASLSIVHVGLSMTHSKAEIDKLYFRYNYHQCHFHNCVTGRTLGTAPILPVRINLTFHIYEK